MLNPRRVWSSSVATGIIIGTSINKKTATLIDRNEVNRCGRLLQSTIIHFYVAECPFPVHPSRRFPGHSVV